MVNFKLLSIVSSSVFVASAVGQRVLCYSGFQYNCTRFIDQFCDHAVANTYNPYDAMSRCFNTGQGSKCDLTVWLQNPTGQNQIPSNANCKAALRTAMQSCVSGGTGQFSGAPFQFGIDPNGGQCIGNIGNGNRLENVTEVVVAPVA
ncbi:TMV resistance protein Y3 [Ephemerocybe angulata]|uniref:TMV resistance protein Y3 n=1 Tax=Ephemerocybe angulata TaxID=980116 RepID=A0A8H6M2T3_9AGAR|nr:TMV resistance protein Y3 [Tulosesus angulatus]